MRNRKIGYHPVVNMWLRRHLYLYLTRTTNRDSTFLEVTSPNDTSLAPYISPLPSFSCVALMTASASFAYLERAPSCASYRTKTTGMRKHVFKSHGGRMKTTLHTHSCDICSCQTIALQKYGSEGSGRSIVHVQGSYASIYWNVRVRTRNKRVRGRTSECLLTDVA